MSGFFSVVFLLNVTILRNLDLYGVNLLFVTRKRKSFCGSDIPPILITDEGLLMV